MENIIVNKTGLLNNSKWRKLFNFINDLYVSFFLKKLNQEEYISCDFIRELEENCLIIDDKTGFIKFVDIERVTLKANPELIAFLDKKNYPFDTEHDLVQVYGYR